MPGPEPRRRNIRLAPEVYAKIGAIALLTTCTTDRKSIFNNPKFADLVLSEISLLHGVDSRVLGFCVMPDHVHLLILNIKGSFLDFMRIFKGRIARELRGQGQSRIWQRSFHDHLLRRNEDISGTLRYLLENPVRAGLVDSWTDYRWCGSLQWPEIDHRFFTVNPASIIWSEVTAEDSGRG